MEKLIALTKKLCSKEVIYYGIFGILTTLINIVVSAILEGSLHVEGNIASTIGILLAVLFAYITNRTLVFHSTATTSAEKWKEFGRFLLGRAATMVFEIVGVFVFYTLLQTPFLLTKIVITVIVIILNFFISKFFAFK